MNLVLLQLKRDFRAGCALLALWWGLCALYVITAFPVLIQDHPGGGGQMAELLWECWWIAGLLAAWWILRDPPDDADAFWRARPVRWPHLLAAKGMLILGGLVLPLALSQGILVTGLGAAAWWPAVLVNLVRTQLGWIVGLAALAALCGSWRRMLTVALAGWVGVVGAYVVLDGLAEWGVLGVHAHRLHGLVLSSSAFLVSGWVAAFCTIALVLQYAFRRPAWTAGTALALAAGWIVLHPGHRMPEPPITSSEPLPEFDVGIQRNQQLWSLDETGTLSGISAVLEMTDPAPPYFVRPAWFARGRVVYSNETVHTAGDVEFWEDTHPRALRMYQSAVPGLTIRNPNPMALPQQVTITLADHEAMQVTVVEKTFPGGQTRVRPAPRPRDYAGRKGVFECTLGFRVMRHMPVAELPLEPGAAWVDGPNRVSVLGSGDSGNGNWTWVPLRIQWLKLEHDRSLDPVHCILVNRERGEALVPTRNEHMRWLRVYPFATQDLRVIYRHRKHGDSAVRIDDDWLAAASVLVVTRSTVGTVTKRLRLEGFRLWPDPGEIDQVGQLSSPVPTGDR